MRAYHTLACVYFDTRIYVRVYVCIIDVALVCAPLSPCVLLTAGLLLRSCQGGNQEARGNSGCGASYIENVVEELDAPSEWFLDSANGALYYLPSNDTSSSLDSAAIEVPVLPRVIQVQITLICVSFLL